MNRSLLSAVAAACGLLCLAAGAQAQQASTGAPSNVKLYGIVDVSAGRFQNIGRDRLYRAESGRMSTSFIGFNGVEDLGGGLQARFALEAFLRADTGANGRFDGDAFYARNAFVGLSGAFGTAQIGRNSTPLFVNTLIFNAYGDSFGFSPSIRQYFVSPTVSPDQSFSVGRSQVVGDTGWNNSLVYFSPRFGGASFTAAVNAGEGAATAVGRNTSLSAYWGSGKMSFGEIAVGGAWQQVKNGLPAALVPGFQKQDTYQIGASFDFNLAKIFAQYGQVRTESNNALADGRARISGLGFSVPVGAGKVLGQYGYSRTTGNGFQPTTWKTATVGYDYNLSKSTDVYLNYMHERATVGTTAVVGVSPPSGIAGSGNTVAAGIRLRF